MDSHEVVVSSRRPSYRHATSSTQIINSYYSNLVNIVYAFGGDIIKIAGDALYCVFMPDENDLRGAVICAAMCSIMLRDVSRFIALLSLARFLLLCTFVFARR